ncbi:hypothetical protein N0V86_001513 [Didymella sp. IMI 355093]|nr:hypothetical protein N0V86_001513 [Didymella sp. IMI 355093]
MCCFIRIFWTLCKHYTLSNTPEHTELCNLALNTSGEIRQGFDKAPACCHPLLEDIEELGTQYRDSDRIAQTSLLYTFCDVCKVSPDFDSEPQGGGAEIEKPVEQFEDYTDDDRMDLAKWFDLHLSATKMAEDVVREFDELLANDREKMTVAIQGIRDEAIRNAFLINDGPERWALFRRSYQDAAGLLNIIASYINMRMPREFVNDLVECVQDKLYQADLRLDISKKLIKSIANYETDPKAHKAAINSYADKLAVRLGRPIKPDPDTFEHLTVEMPQHVQDTIATKESIRRLSIAEHASATRTHTYTPRRAFGASKNTKALTINTERVWHPRPESRADLPILRTTGEDVEVVYDAQLQTSACLGHIGVGPWDAEHVLAQREVLDHLAEEDEGDNNDDTLVESSERPGALVPSSKGEGWTVAGEATFMGLSLEDTDSEAADDEASDGDDDDRGQKVVRRDADGQQSVETDDSVGQRDDNGRFVKKRKCSE